MNSNEYYTEVNAIAEALVAEAMADNDNNKEQALDEINDWRLHETIDSHQWIIYYSHNLSIIEHSSNDEYMIDNLGLDSAGEALKNGGLNGLHQALAFWALYADVCDCLDDAMNEHLDKLESEENE